MHMLRRLAAFAAITVSLSLAGCGATEYLTNLFSHGSAPQANTVAAAEGFYTVSANTIAEAINQGVFSADVVTTIQKDENVVYADLVKVRTAAENHDSAALAALMAAYNTAFGSLYSDAQKNGVNLDVSKVPNPTTPEVNS